LCIGAGICRGHATHLPPHNLREVVNGVMHLLATSCSWRSLPKDFPPFTTVRNHFHGWSRSGLLNEILAFLMARERQRTGRSAAPTAAIIDSRSVSTVEARSDTCGYDAGKKIKGRKRHLVVDADGNPLAAQVHPADVQDRDGAVPLLLALQAERKTVETVFADSACSGDKLASALVAAGCRVTVEVVKKPKGTKGFVLLPRRWVVERTFGWLRRCRRLAKDVERTIASSLAWFHLAMIRVLLRRLGRWELPVIN